MRWWTVFHWLVSRCQLPIPLICQWLPIRLIKLHFRLHPSLLSLVHYQSNSPNRVTRSFRSSRYSQHHLSMTKKRSLKSRRLQNLILEILSHSLSVSDHYYISPQQNHGQPTQTFLKIPKPKLPKTTSLMTREFKTILRAGS